MFQSILLFYDRSDAPIEINVSIYHWSYYLIVFVQLFLYYMMKQVSMLLADLMCVSIYSFIRCDFRHANACGPPCHQPFCWQVSSWLIKSSDRVGGDQSHTIPTVSTWSARFLVPWCHQIYSAPPDLDCGFCLTTTHVEVLIESFHWAHKSCVSDTSYWTNLLCFIFRHSRSI